MQRKPKKLQDSKKRKRKQRDLLKKQKRQRKQQDSPKKLKKPKKTIKIYSTRSRTSSRRLKAISAQSTISPLVPQKLMSLLTMTSLSLQESILTLLT